MPNTKAYTVANAGMTVLASGSLTSTVVTLSSISGAYKNLRLVLRNPYPAVTIRLNNDSSTGAYPQVGTNSVNGAGSVISELATQIYGTWNGLVTTQQSNALIFNLLDYTSTSSFKMWDMNSFGITASPTNGISLTSLNGTYKSTSAVNRIDIISGSGSFAGGTYILYGVN